MLRIPITRVPLTAEQSLQTLKERGVLTNRYAEMYISHPCFSAGGPGEMTAAVASLEELGLGRGASLDELLRHIKEHDSRPVLRTRVISFASHGQISRKAGTPFLPEHTVRRIKPSRFCQKRSKGMTLSQRGFICARWTAIFGFGAMCAILHTAFRAARFLRLKCAGHERLIPVCEGNHREKNIFKRSQYAKRRNNTGSRCPERRRNGPCP